MATKTDTKTDTKPAIDFSALTEPETVTFATTEDVPAEVQAFVQDGYRAWQANPNVWRRVNLGTPEAAGEVRRMAKVYAGQTGVTFRTKSTKDGTLVYKVTDKVTRRSGGSA